MATLTAPYTLYAAQFGSNLIDQVISENLDVATQQIIQGGDGGVYPLFAAIAAQEPKIGFTTTKLAAALGVIGLNGLSLTGNIGLFYWQRLIQSGTRAGTLAHLSATINEGIVVPVSIDAQQDGNATISYMVHANYDETNNPIVFATGVSLTGSPTISEMFTLGPVNINGAELAGVQSVSIAFNIEMATVREGGQIWNTFNGVMAVKPTITIRTLDQSAMTTPGLLGAVQGATDSVVYFRKKVEGGGNVTDATAENVSVSVDAGHIHATASSGEQDGFTGTDITITPTFDGTAPILAFSTATAIT